MKHISAAAIGLAIGASAALIAQDAFSQSDAGWITLLDGRSLGN